MKRLNVIMPMGGGGTRFGNHGFNVPKPLIEIYGKPFFYWATQSLVKNIEIEKATLPFYKSSKDISTEHLGLGLNISKILSERHGGNIQITNNKAGGACVTVKINCNES